MATYGDNILPALSHWTCVNCSVSGSLNMPTVGGYAECSMTSTEYHLGDTGVLKTNITKGTVGFYMKYQDTENDELYYTLTHRLKASTEYIVQIPSAVITLVEFRLSCIEPAVVNGISFQLSTSANTSREEVLRTQSF